MRLRQAWRNGARAASLAAALAVGAEAASALDRFEFRVPGGNDSLVEALRGASLLVAARAERNEEAQDLFGAARADYGRLLGALYAQGHYSGVIRILIDGREAAAIAPLDAPSRIGAVAVIVEPGPRFSFSRAAIGPLARDTELPPGYAIGKPARSGVIVSAAEAGVAGWREIGHAKARVAGQRITADHRAARLAAEIGLEPGPRLRFGNLTLSGYQRMTPRRLDKIAGFPEGEVFSPERLAAVEARLRRTGVFRAFTLTEAERPNPDGTLDFELAVVEERPRRLGFGAEISGNDGLMLSGYWLHRNLLGGAERLRLDGEISGIGGEGGEDYTLGIRIDRPATLSPDTSAFVEARAERIEETDYVTEDFTFGFGLSHVFNERLTGTAGISYLDSTVTDAGGETDFRLLALPLTAVWDNRDTPLDATEGYYLNAGLTPFRGFDTTGSGTRFTADARAYRGFGEDDRFVLAARVQVGTVLGATLGETPRNYLFFSGGGGTVRGHPYRSLGIELLRGAESVKVGGRNFLALSGELRADITDRIGVVGFYDAGYISAVDFFDDTGEWHSGAGLGLRYDTGFGPIRLDVAAPVSGDTGDGVQFYIGIGQAF